MTQKDWILLTVPILCNGVVVFILQKIFEKRQLKTIAKQKYVSILQGKIDVSLAHFMNVVQTAGGDFIQINCLNQFVKSFLDVHYYYQQNQTLFRSIHKEMDEASKIYEAIQTNQQKLGKADDDTAVRIQIEELFRTLYKLLQKVQNKCIKYQV